MPNEVQLLYAWVFPAATEQVATMVVILRDVWDGKPVGRASLCMN